MQADLSLRLTHMSDGTLSNVVHCKKNPVDFTVKCWQLAVSAFTVNFTGALEPLQDIPRGMGYGWVSMRYGALAHISTLSCLTYLVLLCPAMRDYSCK